MKCFQDFYIFRKRPSLSGLFLYGLQLAFSVLTLYALYQQVPIAYGQESPEQDSVAEKMADFDSKRAARQKAFCQSEAFNPHCTRMAQVGERKIFVDPISLQKGEGLRSLYEEDPLSLKLLEEYQEGTKDLGNLAYIGTPGVALTAWRLTSSDDLSKDALFWGGISIVMTSFFVGRWMSDRNENYFQSALERYNTFAKESDRPLVVIQEN